MRRLVVLFSAVALALLAGPMGCGDEPIETNQDADADGDSDADADGDGDADGDNGDGDNGDGDNGDGDNGDGDNGDGDGDNGDGDNGDGDNGDGDNGDPPPPPPEQPVMEFSVQNETGSTVYLQESTDSSVGPDWLVLADQSTQQPINPVSNCLPEACDDTTTFSCDEDPVAEVIELEDGESGGSFQWDAVDYQENTADQCTDRIVYHEQPVEVVVCYGEDVEDDEITGDPVCGALETPVEPDAELQGMQGIIIQLQEAPDGG